MNLILFFRCLAGNFPRIAVPALTGGLLVFLLSSAHAQTLFENPSFEGRPYSNSPPPNWQNCQTDNVYSTPDVQPGSWEVVTPPKHGNTYLGMVCRLDGTYEAVYQKLVTPLLPGGCYSFDVHLAHSPVYEMPLPSAVLRIWGATDACDHDELLWVSPRVEHLDWQAYLVELRPARQHNYLRFEAYYDASAASLYRGHILIDHIMENPARPFPPETAGLGPDKIVCTDQSVTLDLSRVGIPIRWSDGSTGPVLNVNKPGTYTAEFSLNCSVYKDTIQVSFYQEPTIDLGSNRVICNGEPVKLKATFPGATYRWNDNSTDSTLTVGKSGTYWVEATTPCGVAKDSVVILFDQKPQQVNLGNDRVVCDGAPVQLKATFPGAAYRWSDDSADSVLTVSRSGTYWVQVTTLCGMDQDTITITFEQTPHVALGADTTVCVGQVLQLNASHPQAKKYFWQGVRGTPIHQVTQEGTYWVEVRNESCFVSDSIKIYFVECDAELFIPNVFTPNGDGINDGFEIKGILPGKWKLQVYNRYGEKVFYSSAYLNNWNGSQLPVGIYYYLLRDTTSPKQYKGWVQILK